MSQKVARHGASIMAAASVFWRPLKTATLPSVVSP
jgi:hypothetical protein